MDAHRPAEDIRNRPALVEDRLQTAILDGSFNSKEQVCLSLHRPKQVFVRPGTGIDGVAQQLYGCLDHFDGCRYAALGDRTGHDRMLERYVWPIYLDGRRLIPKRQCGRSLTSFGERRLVR